MLHANSSDDVAVREMLLRFTLIAAAVAIGADDDGAKKNIRDNICALKVPAVPGDRFSLLAVPTPDRRNESGVLILVNCSDRKIVSIRDPSPPHRRLTEYVYDPQMRRRFRGDPHQYEFINFNERAANSFAELNSYSRNTYWRGRCRFDGLELTTAAPDNDQDRKTITFSLDICGSHVFALVTP